MKEKKQKRSVPPGAFIVSIARGSMDSYGESQPPQMKNTPWYFRILNALGITSFVSGAGAHATGYPPDYSHVPDTFELMTQPLPIAGLIGSFAVVAMSAVFFFIPVIISTWQRFWLWRLQKTLDHEVSYKASTGDLHRLKRNLEEYVANAETYSGEPELSPKIYQKELKRLKDFLENTKGDLYKDTSYSRISEGMSVNKNSLSAEDFCYFYELLYLASDNNRLTFLNNRGLLKKWLEKIKALDPVLLAFYFSEEPELLAACLCYENYEKQKEVCDEKDEDEEDSEVNDTLTKLLKDNPFAQSILKRAAVYDQRLLLVLKSSPIFNAESPIQLSELYRSPWLLSSYRLPFDLNFFLGFGLGMLLFVSLAGFATGGALIPMLIGGAVGGSLCAFAASVLYPELAKIVRRQYRKSKTPTVIPQDRKWYRHSYYQFSLWIRGFTGGMGGAILGAMIGTVIAPGAGTLLGVFLGAWIGAGLSIAEPTIFAALGWIKENIFKISPEPEKYVDEVPRWYRLTQLDLPIYIRFFLGVQAAMAVTSPILFLAFGSLGFITPMALPFLIVISVGIAIALALPLIDFVYNKFLDWLIKFWKEEFSLKKEKTEKEKKAQEEKIVRNDTPFLLTLFVCCTAGFVVALAVGTLLAWPGIIGLTGVLWLGVIGAGVMGILGLAHPFLLEKIRLSEKKYSHKQDIGFIMEWYVRVFGGALSLQAVGAGVGFILGTFVFPGFGSVLGAAAGAASLSIVCGAISALVGAVIAYFMPFIKARLQHIAEESYQMSVNKAFLKLDSYDFGYYNYNQKNTSNYTDVSDSYTLKSEGRKEGKSPWTDSDEDDASSESEKDDKKRTRKRRQLIANFDSEEPDEEEAQTEMIVYQP